MPDQIGAHEFVFVRGPVSALMPHYANVSDELEDGIALQQIGSTQEPARIRAGKAYASRTAGNSALATYRAMVGTVVTLKREGVDETSVFLLSVAEVPESRISSPTYSGTGPGEGAHWMETGWVGVYGASP